MLCHHTGECPLGGAVLDRSRRFEGAEPVRVVAGIFFGFLNQKSFTLPYLFPENSLKFFLCHNSPHFTP